MKQDKWLVSVKGSWERNGWEIFLVRSSNNHGLKSWGWYDQNNKIPVSISGPYYGSIPKELWRNLIKLAENTANELNIKEFSPLAEALNEKT